MNPFQMLKMAQQGLSALGTPPQNPFGSVPAVSPAVVSGPQGQMSDWKNAIASIESAGSGDYGAIGPTHPELGRALGRYQVMEANIGPWSEEHLGQRITPEQFMASPEAQDRIFEGEFGKYVEKFGLEGAAQAWFGGEGGVGKENRKDSLGTSIGGYGNKFMNALGDSRGSGGHGVTPGTTGAAGNKIRPEDVPTPPGFQPIERERKEAPEKRQRRGGAQVEVAQTEQFGPAPVQGGDYQAVTAPINPRAVIAENMAQRKSTASLRALSPAATLATLAEYGRRFRVGNGEQ